ncbi:hypothetical protein JHU04_004593, partial [Brenneria sp. 4F2]|nr:hypothetical protein [Brenneria bubanii]
EKMLEYYQSLFNADSFQVNPEDIKKNDLYFRQESFPAHEKVRQLLDYVHKQNDVRDVSELDAIIDSIRQEFGSIISNFHQFIIVLL